ncbi:hypothetical protein CcCBS67573_g07447 [Chytriomyces confervae]|uniref:Crinkler (CRN) family protein n=1 Tax=Chytriomyces confervae TaxID=246404 RepID=A0A507EWM4_9FUNG|nr:hypothetical protein CcCBS67573_g07447 [Chytriomyces confervae]
MARYLNVKYNTSPITEVNVTGVTRLGGVQDAIKAKFAHTLPMAASEIQLHDTDNNPITDFDDIHERYFEKIGKNDKSGGFTLTIQPVPTPEASSLSVIADTIPAFTQQTIDGELVPEITADLKAFKDAQLVDGCIVSPSQAFLPYSPEKLKKLYVRLCYEDVFDLLVEGVEGGLKSFAITGTLGIGKSPFFIYLLYRLMKSRSVGTSQSSPRLLNATRIVFQTSEIYQCFDLVKQEVFHVEDVEVAKLVRESNTLYIITATDIPVIPSSCVTLFIAAPMSEEYQQFVKKARILKLCFPVWTELELKACRKYCYPDVPEELLLDRLWLFGGIPKYIFQSGLLVTHDDLEAALADKHAANRIRNAALDREMNGNVHMLMHMVVSEDGQYRYAKATMASKQITERLFDNYPEQMLFILQEQLRRDDRRMRFE